MTVTLCAFRLFRIARRLHSGDDLHPEDREALADALNAYLSRAAPDLDTAMGLKPTPGGRDWRTTGKIALRDELIRVTAARFCSGLPIATQAERLYQALDRYASGAWRREHDHSDCPPRHKGTIQEACWNILRVHDHPPSARRIRAILSVS